MRKRSSASIAWRTIGRLLVDAIRFLSLGFRSRSRLAAENLFLRKQLALYVERRVRSRRADDATRLTLVVLARLIDWRAALTIVKPETLIRWHRKGFRLFWRWKSKPGRPRRPRNIRELTLLKWQSKTQLEGNPALPRNCLSNSESTFRPERCAPTGYATRSAMQENI